MHSSSIQRTCPLYLRLQVGRPPAQEPLAWQVFTSVVNVFAFPLIWYPWLQVRTAVRGPPDGFPAIFPLLTDALHVLSVRKWGEISFLAWQCFQTSSPVAALGVAVSLSWPSATQCLRHLKIVKSLTTTALRSFAPTWRWFWFYGARWMAISKWCFARESLVFETRQIMVTCALWERTILGDNQKISPKYISPCWSSGAQESSRRF